MILLHFWPASTVFAYGNIILPNQVILQEKFQNFLVFFCLEKGEIPPFDYFDYAPSFAKATEDRRECRISNDE